jgi:hypothetical protein
MTNPDQALQDEVQSWERKSYGDVISGAHR